MNGKYDSGLLNFGKSILKVIYGIGNRKLNLISTLTPHLKKCNRYLLLRTDNIILNPSKTIQKNQSAFFYIQLIFKFSPLLITTYIPLIQYN